VAPRLALKLAPLLVLLALAPAAAHGAARRAQLAQALIGISDDSPATFSDPRFRWLGMSIARLVVPWDVLTHPAEIAAANQWLAAARATGVQPLVVFEHSTQRPRELPSVAVYAHEVRSFIRFHRWVRTYGTWDEENHYTEPTARDPARAAAYYQVLQGACPTCTVIAADVLDESSMTSWVRRFLGYAPNARLWGLHNYFDLNHGGSVNTRKLLALVHGSIWFTETGGLVWRYDRPSRQFIVRGEPYAGRAAGRLLSLAAVSPRIQRIYYYHWRSRVTLAQARRHPGVVTWDSGLLRPDCSLRPAFGVIAQALGKDPARAPRAVPAAGGLACVAPPPPRRRPKEGGGPSDVVIPRKLLGHGRAWPGGAADQLRHLGRRGHPPRDGVRQGLARGARPARQRARPSRPAGRDRRGRAALGADGRLARARRRRAGAGGTVRAARAGRPPLRSRRL
jgi:hypothetical protein